MPWRRPSERTEIVHIVVTGYQKRKHPQKYYVFVIDVTWNNNDRFEVYRRYSEFFSFQTTLKAMFPAAAGRRPKESRTIPALPKRIFVGRSHVARVAEARLEHINRYCQTLISLEPKVSESAHLIGFFSPRIGDKQLPRLHLHRPASLHPLMVPRGSLFEEYCALAEYQAEDESQVSFKTGDKVLVLNKDDSGWWMCQCNGQVGWGPPSYLKKACGKESDSDSEDDYVGLQEYLGNPAACELTTNPPLSMSPPTYHSQNKEDADREESNKESDDSGLDTQTTDSENTSEAFSVPAIEAEEYRAIDSYEAEGPGQISFEEGDIISVLDKIEDGWWFVSKGQEEGWAPCSYLESLTGGNEEDNMISSLDIIEKYTTVDGYTAEEDDEISFARGLVVDVLQKSLDGWWLVRCEGKTGLAPATFLKKASEQSEAGQIRKVTPPPQQPNFQLPKAYQQPPRKQSVRLRVSTKKQKKEAKEKLGKAAEKTHSNTVSGTNSEPPHKNSGAELPHKTSDPQSRFQPPRKTSDPELRFEPPRKTSDPGGPLNGRLRFEPYMSPGSSDSEDNDESIQQPSSPKVVDFKFTSKLLQSKLKKFERRSGSDSSLSEDSNPSTPTRPPPTPPRVSSAPKPPVQPKPPRLHAMGKSRSFKSDKDAKPVGTHMLRHRPSVPLITEEPPPSDSRPIPPRPTGTQIRKVHERSSKSPSPLPPSPRSKSPLTAVWEESGEESDSSSYGARLLSQARLKPTGKNRSQSSADANGSLAPPLPRTSRPRGATEGDASNPFNQQMADTLIKYILASNDPGLKLAIVDIVKSNPEVLRALKEE